MYTLKLTHAAYVQPHLLILAKTLSDSVDLGTLYNSATQRTVSPCRTVCTAFAMLTSSQFLYFPSRNTQELALQFLAMAKRSFTNLLAHGIPVPVTLPASFSKAPGKAEHTVAPWM